MADKRDAAAESHNRKNQGRGSHVLVSFALGQSIRPAAGGARCRGPLNPLPPTWWCARCHCSAH
eukprot:15466539-Alexandrium_andersonii.AAC.1